MLKIIEPNWQLDWLKRTYRMPEQLELGRSHEFGPHTIRGNEYYVRYIAETDSWELLRYYDNSTDEYHQRRGTVVQLAEEHRSSLRPGQFVQLLIQACISNEINKRDDILDTVELAANLPAIKQTYETNEDLASVPTQFGDKFIRGVLARYRGPSPSKHLWWVDDAKVYHLH